MYLLYPRLPLPAAVELVKGRSNLPLDELIDLSRDIHHPDIQFAPTGGRKADPDTILYPLQREIRKCAEIYGYPHYSLANRSAAREFDFDCATTLQQILNIHPSEASDLRMWAYMTCILVPDIVCWRFPANVEDIEEDIENNNSQKKVPRLERFVGKDRGLRRNTFGRLWWRAYLLYDENENNPYWLLKELYEDEVVQITERNSIAASPILITVFADVFLQTVKQFPSLTRRTLIREAVKRLRRLLPIVSFDALSPDDVREMIKDIFVVTITSLTKV
jgi:hypothetical protein